MSRITQQTGASVQQLDKQKSYLYENNQQFSQNIRQNQEQSDPKDEFNPLFPNFNLPKQPNIQQNTTPLIDEDLLDVGEPIVKVSTQVVDIAQPLSKIERLMAELKQVQNELASANTSLGNKSTGLIGTRNNVQTQRNRAEKTLSQAQGIEAQLKAQKTFIRYENELKDVLPKITAQNAIINDLKGKEKQLQLKLQTIETPFEIKEVYHG